MSDQNTTDELTESLPYTECPPVGTIVYWQLEDTDGIETFDDLMHRDTRAVVIRDVNNRVCCTDIITRVHDGQVRVVPIHDSMIQKMFRTQRAAILAGLREDAKFYREGLQKVLDFQKALTADE